MTTHFVDEDGDQFCEREGDKSTDIENVDCGVCTLRHGLVQRHHAEFEGAWTPGNEKYVRNMTEIAHLQSAIDFLMNEGTSYDTPAFNMVWEVFARQNFESFVRKSRSLPEAMMNFGGFVADVAFQVGRRTLELDLHDFDSTPLPLATEESVAADIERHTKRIAEEDEKREKAIRDMGLDPEKIPEGGHVVVLKPEELEGFLSRLRSGNGRPEKEEDESDGHPGMYL